MTADITAPRRAGGVDYAFWTQPPMRLRNVPKKCCHAIPLLGITASHVLTIFVGASLMQAFIFNPQNLAEYCTIRDKTVGMLYPAYPTEEGTID